MKKQIIENLKEYLAGMTGIRLAFLFGSAAQDRLGPESDVDIAVEFEQVPQAFEKSRLQLDLTDLLHREVDLVVLNGASPILRMQVLRNGLLFLGEKRHYCQFFVNTVNQYDDLKRVRAPIEAAVLNGETYA